MITAITPGFPKAEEIRPTMHSPRSAAPFPNWMSQQIVSIPISSHTLNKTQEHCKNGSRAVRMGSSAASSTSTALALGSC